MIKSLPAARFGRCSLRGLSANGLEFEISFFATAPSQTPLPELRQQFMLRLLEQLSAVNLGFAASGTIVSTKKAAPAPSQQATA